MQAVGPVVGSDVGGRSIVRLHADGDHAGIVDADVDVTGDPEGSIDERLRNSVAHQVAHEAAGRKAQLLQLGDASVNAIGGRSDHDLRTVGCKRLGAGEADPVGASRTGDDCDLAVELHVINASTADANTTS